MQREDGRKFLGLGLTALAACGVLLWLQPPDFSKFDWAMTYFGLVVGAAGAAPPPARSGKMQY